MRRTKPSDESRDYRLSVLCFKGSCHLAKGIPYGKQCYSIRAAQASKPPHSPPDSPKPRGFPRHGRPAARLQPFWSGIAPSMAYRPRCRGGDVAAARHRPRMDSLAGQILLLRRQYRLRCRASPRADPPRSVRLAVESESSAPRALLTTKRNARSIPASSDRARPRLQRGKTLFTRSGNGIFYDIANWGVLWGDCPLHPDAPG